MKKDDMKILKEKEKMRREIIIGVNISKGLNSRSIELSVLARGSTSVQMSLIKLHLVFVRKDSSDTLVVVE